MAFVSQFEQELAKTSETFQAGLKALVHRCTGGDLHTFATKVPRIEDLSLDFIREIPTLKFYLFEHTENNEAAVREFLSWLENTPGALEAFFTYNVPEMDEITEGECAREEKLLQAAGYTKTRLYVNRLPKWGGKIEANVNPLYLTKVCAGPPNAFIQWCNAGAREKAAEENPLLNSRELGRVLGQKWH
jgi:hypothetical protein